ncbi:aspartate aminotransferase family protein [Ahrensia sp. R2A130]|uniref:aspartate aminotransferase family protein n=1 Tax=Ahrensia sp. R2A130 TaxID=744979 RepID=UPI0001E0AC72|nr:aspartate aminotransferase family protein [Ahrensia sp. R2A130]EFL90695.1 aminotransferase, class III [Ahrensia sp. R2A130]
MAYRNFSTEQLQVMDNGHHLHPFTDHTALHEGGVRVVTQADGHHFTDSDGKKILDAMAGLWCVNIGYGREELAKVAYDQMRELAYYNTFFKTTHPAVAQLAKRISDLAPAHMNRVFFGASGSESNDTAIRTVRHYWNLVGKPDKQIIVSRQYGYHGSTIAASSMGGFDVMHAQLGPALPGFRHVMAPYAFGEAHDGESDEVFGLRAAQTVEDEILAAGPENVAAFVGEPIQGAGGVKIPPANYWGEVQRICRKYDVLLMLDEVITGFGRTGEWFGCQAMGIEPDTMTLAKAITSGYQPLSAVVFSDRVADVISSNGEYFHGYTYSGHPVACAVALENIDIIEREGLVERVRDETGPYLTQRLNEVLGDHAIVGEIRGFGLLAAIEIVKDKTSKERFHGDLDAASVVRDHCIEAGMMMRAVGDTMILSPPLTWTKNTIDEAAELARIALDKTAAELL